MILRPGTRSLSVLAAALTLLLVVGGASAKTCGDGVACECGDVLVGTATLSANLASCRVGIEVRSGVLDCAGHSITGPGSRSSVDGIWVRNATAAEVRNCRINDFRRGIYIGGGSANRLHWNVVRASKVGIQLGGGTSESRVELNDVGDSDEDGIHLGAGTWGNRVGHNHVRASGAESLFLIESHDNVIEENVLEQSREVAILLRNAVDNRFYRNTVVDRPVLVRGDSHGNRFEENEVQAGGFTFQAFKDNGWGYPHGNVVVGGLVNKGSTCFRFTGAYDNTVEGVSVDRCRVVQEKEEGGLVPCGNIVDVIADPPTDPDDEPPVSVGCDETGGNVASLRYDRRGIDRLKIQWTFELPPEVDSGEGELEVVLADGDRIGIRVLAPPGALTEDRAGYRFNDKQGETVEGLVRVRLSRLATGWWLRLTVQGDIDVDGPELILRWRIGDTAFVVTEGWKQTTTGWKTAGETEPPPEP